MALRVYYPGSPEDALIEQLQSQLAEEVTLEVGESSGSYQVLVAGRPTEEQLSGSGGLEAVVIPFAGLPTKTRDVLLEHPELAVYNLHHNAAATAEMAVGLLVAAARGMVVADRQLRSGNWTIRYESPPAIQLAGRTAVILGYGAIGRRVGAACAAFGMEVRGVNRRGGHEAVPIQQLPGLLPAADALIICVPATPETNALIGRDELSLLPPSSILVNVGRAAVVDEQALFEALSEHRLHGAGLDVWYQYPETEDQRSATAPSRFPFERLDNVVMSPHRAGHTDDTARDRARHLARLLNGIAGADAMPVRVDLEAGY